MTDGTLSSGSAQDREALHAAPSLFVSSVAVIVVILGLQQIAVVSAEPILPLLADAVICTCYVFWMRGKFRDGAPLSVGLIYALIVFVYATYPIAVYLLLGGYYTPLNDARLYSEQPTPYTVNKIGWYYSLYLASFVTAYVVAGRRSSFIEHRLVEVRRSTVWAVFAVMLLLRLTSISVQLLWAQPGDDYLASYLKYSHLPLLAQQVIGHVEGIGLVASVAAVVVSCADWRRYRWLVGSWVLGESLVLLIGLGSRTQVALLCLALLVSYHWLHRRLSLPVITACSGLLLVAFLGVGFLRAASIGGAPGVATEVMAGNSEFEAVFANAVDLDRIDQAGELDRGELGLAPYAGGFVGLIPRQLLPFEKIDLSSWYVQTYYPQYGEAGGGLAFGAIAESIAGAGELDILWRAVVVGVFFAWVDRMLTRERLSSWAFIFYVWIISSCYQVFRSGTFALLPLFVYRFLPAVSLMAITAAVLRAAGRGKPTLARQAPMRG
jgi:hypothetical protein